MQPPRPDRADAAKLSRRPWPACRHDGHEADVLELRELRPQVIDAPAPLLGWEIIPGDRPAVHEGLPCHASAGARPAAACPPGRQPPPRPDRADAAKLS